VTTYTKPAVRNAWGQAAGGSDLQDPGNTYASNGWQIGVKPPRQYFNWVLNYNMAGIRYLCQNGIPGWDAGETYANLSYALSPAGYLCRAIATTTNQNPDTAGNFGPAGPWDNPNVKNPPYPDNTSRIPNTAWVTTNFLPVGTTFGSIGGQVSAGQVPVSAVTQWQGSLSIGGGQVTSAVARANTIFNTSGQYATFNWSGQSGQPTWLWGSNDGLNFYVWNPSNFNVNGALLLQGLAPSFAAVGSTVVSRDPNGYVEATYFNQSSGSNENPPISQIMVTNGVDNFLRKAGIGALFNALASLGFLTSANFAGSGALNGYQKFSNGIILQWGFVSGSGLGPTQVSATFPIAFPSQCLATFCNTFRTTGGNQGANFVATSSRFGATYVFDNMPSPVNTCGGYFFAVGI